MASTATATISDSSEDFIVPDVLPQLLPSQTPVPVRATAAARLVADARGLEFRGLFSAAEAVFQTAVRSDDSPHSLLELAEFLTRRERLEAARERYQDLWRLSVERNDSRLMEVVLHNLAVVERSLGEPTRAQQLQARALALSFENVGPDRQHDAAADLTNRALDAMATGDYPLAENLLLRSLCLERQSGSRGGEAADFGNLGVLAGLRGDLIVGIRFLGRAYRLHRELADEQGAGSDLLNLAEFFLKLGRLSLAAHCLRRAIQNFERCGAERSGEQAAFRLAEIQHVQRGLEHDPEWN